MRNSRWYTLSLPNATAFVLMLSLSLVLYWNYEPVVPNAKTIADDIVDESHNLRNTFRPGETVYIKRTWEVTKNFKNVTKIVRVLVDADSGFELYRQSFDPSPPIPGTTVTRYLSFKLPDTTPPGNYYISPRITIELNPLRNATYHDKQSKTFRVAR